MGAFVLQCGSSGALARVTRLFLCAVFGFVSCFNFFAVYGFHPQRCGHRSTLRRKKTPEKLILSAKVQQRHSRASGSNTLRVTTGVRLPCTVAVVVEPVVPQLVEEFNRPECVWHHKTCNPCVPLDGMTHHSFTAVRCIFASSCDVTTSVSRCE